LFSSGEVIASSTTIAWHRPSNQGFRSRWRFPHTCDFSVFEETVKAITKQHLPAMAQLHEFFIEKSSE
jgi:hypothetical protein